MKLKDISIEDVITVGAIILAGMCCVKIAEAKNTLLPKP